MSVGWDYGRKGLQAIVAMSSVNALRMYTDLKTRVEYGCSSNLDTTASDKRPDAFICNQSNTIDMIYSFFR